MADVLTKAMFSAAWDEWRRSGNLKFEPGEYSGRAEARRAAKRAKLESGQGKHLHDYGTGL